MTDGSRAAGEDGPTADGDRQRPPVSHRFQRSKRLLDRRDFDRVLKTGRRRSSPELVVVTAARPAKPAIARGRRGGMDTGGSRLGITVGRKAGCAVERNKFKRRVREWFRVNGSDLENSLDIVIIARRPAVSLSLSALGERLGHLLVRHSARNG